jgi:hypothetical protein
MLEIGKRMPKMEKEFIIITVEIGMKESLKMTMEKDKVFFIIIMAKDMKGNFIKESLLVSIQNIILMVLKKKYTIKALILIVLI